MPFTEQSRARARQARQAGTARTKRIELAILSVDALCRDQNGPIPAWAQSHLDRARKGNVRAMVAAKCADCVAFERDEIKKCEVVSCPLWAVRPYKTSELTEGQRQAVERAKR
jgi:hypothetical protein